MKLILFFTLFIPTLAFGKEPQKNNLPLHEGKVPVKEGYETLNMDEFKNVNQSVASKSGVTFSQTCRGRSGVEYKSNESGYESCLREAQLDNTHNNMNRVTPGGIKVGN